MTQTSNQQDLPILAIHGFTGDGQDFALLRERTPARAWQTPTVVGHDPAHAPRDVTFYTMPACVRQILDDAPERFDLLGYSMGGRVALHIAMSAPDRVRRLGLIGATPGIQDPQEAGARRRSDDALAAQIEELGTRAFLERWRDKPIIATQSRIEPGALAAMRARRDERLAHGLANSLRGMGTGAMAPVWDRLHELDGPTWLVTGREDAKFDAIAQRMLARLANGVHVRVEGAGHCAHLERPDAFLEALSGFFGSHP